MAELLIKPTAGAGYEAGDVLCAANRRRIRWQHAQTICHPWHNGVSKDGLRIAGSIVEDFLRHASSRKYERISPTELRRTDLATSKSVVLSALPVEDPDRPGHYIRCNVARFVARRLAERAPDGGPKLAMFGEPGAEYWYGHRKDFSHAKLDLVWADIERKSAHREVDYPRWPLGEEELRSFLAIEVDDFDDPTVEELVAPLMANETPEAAQLKKRRRYVDWQTSLALTASAKTQILDRARVVDLRPLATFPLASVVQVKA